MPKNKNLDEFDNFDDDFGDIDFGDTNQSPPKNTREAVTRTFSDAAKTIFPRSSRDYLDYSKDVLNKALPDSISDDFSNIKDNASKIKDEFDKSLSKVSKSSGEFIKKLNNLLPKSSFVYSFTKKIEDKISSQNEEIKQISKEKEQDTAINTELASIFKTSFDKQYLADMVKQDIEKKRHASTTELLTSTLAETKQINSFNIEVSNRYYRKSLELQYRQLYLSKEQNEILKTSYDAFKIQFESIIKNTSLPDLVKLKASEQLYNKIADKYRESVSEKIHKSFNPLENFTTNIITKINRSASDFSNSLTMLNDSPILNNDGAGLSLGSILGLGIRDFITDKIGNKIKDRYENNNKIKNTAYRFRQFTRDTKGFFNDLEDIGKQYAKSKTDNLGFKKFFGRSISKLGKFGSKFTTEKNDSDTTFLDKVNLYEPAVFNNAVQISITKLIPTILNRIYGEVKANREMYSIVNRVILQSNNYKYDETSNDLAYDINTGTIMSKRKIISKFNKERMTHVDKDLYPNLKNLLNIYASLGVELKSDEEAAIISSVMDNILNSGTNDLKPSYLISKSFVRGIKDKELAERVLKVNKSLLEALKNSDISVSDNLYNLLDELRTSSKNYKNIIMSMDYGGLREELLLNKDFKFTKNNRIMISRTNINKILKTRTVNRKHNINYNKTKDTLSNIKYELKNLKFNPNETKIFIKKAMENNWINTKTGSNILNKIAILESNTSSKKDIIETKQYFAVVLDELNKSASKNPNINIEFQNFLKNMGMSSESSEAISLNDRIASNLINSSWKSSINSYLDESATNETIENRVKAYNRLKNDFSFYKKSLSDLDINVSDIDDFYINKNKSIKAGGNVNNDEIRKTMLKLRRGLKDKKITSDIYYELMYSLEEFKSNNIEGNIKGIIDRAIGSDSPAMLICKKVMLIKSKLRFDSAQTKAINALDSSSNDLSTAKNQLYTSVGKGFKIVNNTIHFFKKQFKDIKVSLVNDMEYIIENTEIIEKTIFSLIRNDGDKEDVKSKISTIKLLATDVINLSTKSSNIDLNYFLNKLDTISLIAMDLHSNYYGNTFLEYKINKVKDMYNKGYDKINNFTNRVKDNFAETDMYNDFNSFINTTKKNIKNTYEKYKDKDIIENLNIAYKFNTVKSLTLDKIDLKIKELEMRNNSGYESSPILGVLKALRKASKDVNNFKDIAIKLIGNELKNTTPSKLFSSSFAAGLDWGSAVINNPNLLADPVYIYGCLNDDIMAISSSIKNKYNNAKSNN